MVPGSQSPRVQGSDGSEGSFGGFGRFGRFRRFRGFRRSGAVLCAAAAVLAAACSGSPAPARIDLLAELPRAEKRAIKPEIAIRTALVGPAGDPRLSLVTDTPARITWTLRLPSHAHLQTALRLVPDANGKIGDGIAARIGISDNRSYQGLLRVVIDKAATSGWQPVDVDLTEYSGWKFSLFYQPSRRDWRLVFGADAAPGGTIAWAQPLITGAR